MVISPSYVVNKDYLDYVSNPPADDEALTKLLEQAERYVDLVGAARAMVRPATDTLHLLDVTGNPTGGDITLVLNIGGLPYSVVVPFNATAPRAAALMAAIPGFPGSPVAVGGPLPYQPIFVGYRGSLRGQVVPEGSVTNTLTGGTAPNATFTLSALGGGVGKRFNLAELSAGDIIAVKSAVCAQAQYMSEMDSKLFDQAQYSSVRGPAFTTSGRLPVVAPKARRELSRISQGITTARSRP